MGRRGMTVRIIDGDCRTVLATLPAESVKLVDKLSPGLLEKLQALGLRVRELGKRMDKGETLEGEFSTVGD